MMKLALVGWESGPNCRNSLNFDYQLRVVLAILKLAVARLAKVNQDVSAAMQPVSNRLITRCVGFKIAPTFRGLSFVGGCSFEVI